MLPSMLFTTIGKAVGTIVKRESDKLAIKKFRGEFTT